VLDTLQQDQKDRIARGRAIADEFDWENVGDRILDVFHRVAEPSAERAASSPKAAA